MAQIPHADKGLLCPLHKKDMSTVCHKCPWWTQVRGKDPQSTEIVDTWSCAVTFLPILLVEVAQRTREAGAATESFRNVMAEATGNIQRATALVKSAVIHALPLEMKQIVNGNDRGN